jgi:hypothetical protein
MNSFFNLFGKTCIAFGLFLISWNTSTAQIIYVAPQSNYRVSSYGVMDLDLDSNGVNDFNLMAYSGQLSGQVWLHGVSINPLSDSNAVAGDTAGRVNLYSSGILLDPTVNQWNDSINFYTNIIEEITNASMGAQCGGPPSYIGVRFLIGSEMHYGWIGVMVGVSCIDIVDWAYNAQPDSSVTTGQVFTTGISSATQQFPVNIIATDHSILVQLNENSNATVTVYNSVGQLINRTTNARGETLIGMENAQAGIYFVEVTQGNKTYSKKIFLQ